MEHRELLGRISINPEIMVGKAFVRGTPFTVQYILKLLAEGKSYEEIEKEHKGIASEDITACLLYASELICSSSSFIVAAESFTMISNQPKPSKSHHL